MRFLAPNRISIGDSLQMLHIPFDRWVKFVMPMIGCLLLIGSILQVLTSIRLEYLFNLSQINVTRTKYI